MEFWNSIEQLGRISNLLQIGLVAFGILTGLLGAASFVVDSRKNKLENVKNIQYQETVSEIEKRTIELKDLEFRKLDDTQISILKEAIKGSNKIYIMAVRHNSKESQNYSQQFERIFEDEGWIVEHFLPFSTSREISKPMIALNDNIDSLIEFEKLKNGFEDAGLPFSVDRLENDNLKKYQIIIDVGIIPANEYQQVIDKIN